MKPKFELDSVAEETRPLVLRPSRAKYLAGFLGSCLLLYGAGSILSQGTVGAITAWLSLFFFGLCALVFAVNLLPGACYLLLEPDGFTVRTFFRDRFTPWREVGSFQEGFMGTSTMVLYHLPESRGGPPENLPVAARGLSQALNGYHGALPDNYGLGTQDLAELMNLWRETALLREALPETTESVRRGEDEDGDDPEDLDLA